MIDQTSALIDKNGAMWQLTPENWESFLVMPKATLCIVTTAHAPISLRYVWHHVQPLEAGGPNTPANQVALCDSCHYSIHHLMWQMAKGLPLSKARKTQVAIAKTGYDACVAAGTVGQIPNEG